MKANIVSKSLTCGYSHLILQLICSIWMNLRVESARDDGRGYPYFCLKRICLIPQSIFSFHNEYNTCMTYIDFDYHLLYYSKKLLNLETILLQHYYLNYWMNYRNRRIDAFMTGDFAASKTTFDLQA